MYAKGFEEALNSLHNSDKTQNLTVTNTSAVTTTTNNNNIISSNNNTINSSSLAMSGGTVVTYTNMGELGRQKSTIKNALVCVIWHFWTFWTHNPLLKDNSFPLRPKSTLKWTRKWNSILWPTTEVLPLWQVSFLSFQKEFHVQYPYLTSTPKRFTKGHKYFVVFKGKHFKNQNAFYWSLVIIKNNFGD